MANAEVANSIQTGDYKTNCHDLGSGDVIIFIHGSGPGVSAYANWRFALPHLSKKFRVIAPDMAGFGYTDRVEGVVYDMDVWVKQIVDLMDTLGVKKAHLVGNSFGGALALDLVIKYPKIFDKVVLMGAMGVDFTLTAGLDQAWGYTPSLENMRALLDTFAYSRELVTDELAKLRYEASIKEGFQESFSSMFPSPRDRYVKAMTSEDEHIKAIDKEVLIIHGRDDKVIPVSNSIKLNNLIRKSQLHVFGECGHWTQIEHKERFNKLLFDFFSE